MKGVVPPPRPAPLPSLREAEPSGVRQVLQLHLSGGLGGVLSELSPCLRRRPTSRKHQRLPVSTPRLGRACAGAVAKDTGMEGRPLPGGLHVLTAPPASDTHLYVLHLLWRKVIFRLLWLLCLQRKLERHTRCVSSAKGGRR